jgi:prefoldin subunit 5
MATANTTSPRRTKASAKSARKTVAGKTSSARRTSAPRTSTQAKTTRAKSARTRTAHQAEATLRQAETATRETVGVFGDYAERAVLIPVGAALIARERVVASVNDTISTYVERDLRQRRREIEKTVSELEERRDAVAKNVPDLANRVQERILSLV